MDSTRPRIYRGTILLDSCRQIALLTYKLWGRYSIQKGNWYVDVITALNLTDYFIALSVDSITTTASLGQYTIHQMCWNTEPSTTNTIRFLWEKEVVAEDGAVYVAIGK